MSTAIVVPVEKIFIDLQVKSGFSQVPTCKLSHLSWSGGLLKKRQEAGDSHFAPSSLLLASLEDLLWNSHEVRSIPEMVTSVCDLPLWKGDVNFQRITQLECFTCLLTGYTWPLILILKMLPWFVFLDLVIIWAHLQSWYVWKLQTLSEWRAQKSPKRDSSSSPSRRDSIESSAGIRESRRRWNKA